MRPVVFRIFVMRAVRGDLDELETAMIAYQENFGGLDPALVLEEIEEQKRERKEAGSERSYFRAKD